MSVLKARRSSKEMSNRYSDQDRREENPNCLRLLRNGRTGWIKITVVLGVIFAFWMTDWAIGPGALSGTEQKGASGAPVAGNQLAHEASPYLREAALEPIQWFPWGDAAFRRAQHEDKPILLDIGAIWCHWCHVMDRESYESEEVARIINENYVAVKVDRDERPDIDARYQMAVSALTGQGGWPLTAFLTPEGKPFFGGTYFPPDDAFGRPGMKRVLESIAQNYKVHRS